MLAALLPLVYIQITPELLTVRNVTTGTTIAEVPELAISKGPKARILAVGPQARLAADGYGVALASRTGGAWRVGVSLLVPDLQGFAVCITPKISQDAAPSL